MSDRLKNLVDQIQKMAQVPGRSRGAKPPAAKPAPGGGGAAKPSGGGTSSVPQRGGGTPKPTGGGGGYAGAGDIQKMQKAMQDLAATISSTINYDALMKGLSQPQTADKKQFEQSYGRDAFSNFLVNTFLRGSATKGVEYDTDPKKSKMEDKKPSDLKYMFIVLDSLKRIGPGSKEFSADGNWGPRTNNALRNMGAMAEAITKLGVALGMDSKAFDPSKVAGLDALIPEKDTDISYSEKAQRAPQITQLLKGVQALFTDFREQVLSNPNYRVFIDGEDSLFKVGPAKEKGVDATAGEKKILDDLSTNGARSAYVNHPDAKFTIEMRKDLIPYLRGPNPTSSSTTISASDLVSQQAFDAWADSHSYGKIKQSNPESWPAVAQSILAQVTEQVNAKMAGKPPQQQAQQPAQQPQQQKA
jgi:hypothetical protein